ncbi:MAG: putative DNA-binding domain-containing protein [Rhodospirillaceae bacterium]|nr:putative DNA-binding domain-containing protein [Rhodospirillaceae bacterium]
MLLDLQRTFRNTVAGPTDDAAALVTTPRRLAIYRNNVQKSLVDVLSAAFPVVQRIVGERFFFALARDFAVKHLPDVPHLSVYGAGFPDFISGHAETKTLPYLSDVARLEWLRGEAYFAADALALDPQALAGVPAQSVSALKLQLHPATRLMQSMFPVHRIWAVHQLGDGDIPAVDMSVAESALITRAQYQVTVREIDAADAVFVKACAKGENLEAAASAALATDEGFDLQGALQSHLMNGTFTSFSL